MRTPRALTITVCGLLLLRSLAQDGWSNRTPGGNEMQNGANINIAPGVFLQGLDRWYFYKGHILGHFRPGWAQAGVHSAPVDTALSWFIANEATGQFSTFAVEAHWEAEREQMGLVPLMVRWHDDDWHFLTNGHLVFLYPFLAVPFLAFAPIGVFLVGFKRVPWRQVLTVFAVVAAVVLSKVLLELYPQSF
jgi:hypothetical protein